MSNRPTYRLKIFNADEVLMDEDVVSISARNDKGNFDILADHSPFITLLERGDVIVRKPDKSSESINIAKGILKFVNNQAVILTNI